MSADSSWDVQTAVFTRLTGVSALTALLARGADSILDHVPEGTAFPYVVLGEASVHPVDGHGAQGQEVILSIHTYSRGSGMHQARQVMSAIYNALHQASFSVPNHNLALCQCMEGETTLEEDGITRHGVQRFQIITEPA